MRHTRAASGIACGVNKTAPPALLLIAEVPRHLIFIVVSFQWEGGIGSSVRIPCPDPAPHLLVSVCAGAGGT